MTNPDQRTGYTSFTPYKMCALCGVRVIDCQPICHKSKDGRHMWEVKLQENHRNRSGGWLTWLFSWDALRRLWRKN